MGKYVSDVPVPNTGIVDTLDKSYIPLMKPDFDKNGIRAYVLNNDLSKLVVDTEYMYITSGSGYQIYKVRISDGTLIATSPSLGGIAVSIAIGENGIYANVNPGCKTVLLNKGTMQIASQSVASANPHVGLIVNSDFVYISTSGAIKKLNVTTLAVISSTSVSWVTGSSFLSESQNYLASYAFFATNYYGTIVISKSSPGTTIGSISMGNQNPGIPVISKDERHVLFAITQSLFREPINAGAYTHNVTLRSPTTAVRKMRVVGDFVFVLVQASDFYDILVYSIGGIEDKGSVSLNNIIKYDPASGGNSSNIPNDFDISIDEKTLFVVNPKGFYIIPMAYVVDKYLKI